MARIPNGRYTKEFRDEAVKLVTEGGLAVDAAARRLSLPKSTLANWVRALRAGKLDKIGRHQKPLSEAELELARLRRELVRVKMERDILKKAAVSSTCRCNTCFKSICWRAKSQGFPWPLVQAQGYSV